MTRARVDRQAARWAARRLDGAEPDGDFEAWKADNPARAAAFDRHWSTAQDPALLEALQLSARRLSARRRAPWPKILAGGLAAAACALLSVAAWPEVQLMTVAPVHLQTPAGQQTQTTLADGSKVTLDGATSLDVQLGAHRRRVRLIEGEAFFDIAHDDARPFLVAAPAGSVRVLGTAFDLESVGDALVLSVHRGRVRLSAASFGHPSTVLIAGQTAMARQGGLSPTMRFDPAAEDWRSGWLETDGVPLDRLVARLNRASPTPIVIADPALAGQQVAGRFRLDEPEALVENLALMHGFQVRRTEGRLELTR